VLSDDELALAIDSLSRKLHSAQRMLAVANGTRLAIYVLIFGGGFAVLALGPAPFLELIEGRRTMATTWDVFAWWIAALAVTSLFGALLAQAVRRRRRRATGWRHRVEDLGLRLASARDEQERRRRQ
jgi:hypothetical protein